MVVWRVTDNKRLIHFYHFFINKSAKLLFTTTFCNKHYIWLFCCDHVFTLVISAGTTPHFPERKRWTLESYTKPSRRSQKRSYSVQEAAQRCLDDSNFEPLTIQVELIACAHGVPHFRACLAAVVGLESVHSHKPIDPHLSRVLELLPSRGTRIVRIGFNGHAI